MTKEQHAVAHAEQLGKRYVERIAHRERLRALVEWADPYSRPALETQYRGADIHACDTWDAFCRALCAMDAMSLQQQSHSLLMRTAQEASAAMRETRQEEPCLFPR